MSIGRDSRYNRSTAIQVVDARGNTTRRLYLDRWPRFRRVSFIDDREYVPTRKDTWSSIGFKTLKSSKAWWAVAEVNRIVNPWEDLQKYKDEGLSLRVPSIIRFNFEFLRFGKNQLK